MSLQVQKWQDISYDWSDIPSKKEAKKEERQKKGGIKGRKRKKERRKVKSTKQ